MRSSSQMRNWPLKRLNMEHQTRKPTDHRPKSGLPGSGGEFDAKWEENQASWSLGGAERLWGLDEGARVFVDGLTQTCTKPWLVSRVSCSPLLTATEGCGPW